jgi:hypothetical protein
MRPYLTVLISALVLLAPRSALADELFAVTPSGKPEAIFEKPPADTIAVLSSYCMSKGWSVTTSTASQVGCEVKMSAGQAILGQLLLGNSYSTPPRQYVQFVAAPLSGGTRVQMTSWVELQMAFGQVRRTDFDTPAHINSQVLLLLDAGGRLPPGTTFPNHVLAGFDGDYVTYERKQAIRVKTIAAGSPAEKAGLQVDDVVFEIAGKRWKDNNGYLDAAAKAADTATYPVQLSRNGKKVSLILERAFRPVVTAPVVPAAEIKAADDIPAPVLSVADELTKLADLRERGILTEAEFQAQKVRVLEAK